MSDHVQDIKLLILIFDIRNIVLCSDFITFGHPGAAVEFLLVN
jgi:hypothetical protein